MLTVGYSLNCFLMPVSWKFTGLHSGCPSNCWIAHGGLHCPASRLQQFLSLSGVHQVGACMHVPSHVGMHCYMHMLLIRNLVRDGLN